MTPTNEFFYQKIGNSFDDAKNSCAAEVGSPEYDNGGIRGMGPRDVGIPKTHREFVGRARRTFVRVGKGPISEEKMKQLAIRAGDHRQTLAQTAEQSLFAMKLAMRTKIEVAESTR